MCCSRRGNAKRFYAARRVFKVNSVGERSVLPLSRERTKIFDHGTRGFTRNFSTQRTQSFFFFNRKGTEEKEGFFICGEIKAPKERYFRNCTQRAQSTEQIKAPEERYFRNPMRSEQRERSLGNTRKQNRAAQKPHSIPDVFAAQWNKNLRSRISFNPS